MRYIAVLLSALALAGCSATAYKDGYYSHSQLSQTMFKVESWTNGFSTRSTAEEIAILRATEIACVKGYGYFDIISSIMLPDGSTTSQFITIELKKNDGHVNAKIAMSKLKKKLNAATSCSF